MSRIGNKPIILPQGVNFLLEQNKVTIKGKLGTIKNVFNLENIQIQNNGSEITLARNKDDKQTRSLHGLYRALLANMVEGVSNGFSAELELSGVGYRASLTGEILELALGYSHGILFQIPSEVKCTVVTEKGKNVLIRLTSFDKFLLGVVVAKLRSLRKKDPYKGKGVLFVGEKIRRKAGKTAGKGKK